MKKAMLAATAILFLLANIYSQDATDSIKNTIKKSKTAGPYLYPNIAGKSLMTPAGWSANGTFVYAGIGGTFPQPYSAHPDLIATGGLGFGNSYKAISFVAGFNANDVSKFSRFSMNFLATHTLPGGTTIGAGALNLFADQSDAPSSYYVRFSHTLQNVFSSVPGFSKINYTIGAGSGRFAKNSDKDVATGKSPNGSIVFGNLSYEIIRNVNVNAEWTGVNLCFTVGVRLLPQLPPLSFGIADVTRFSGDKARFVLGIGYALYL